MKFTVALTTVLLALAGTAQARDPLAPLDSAAKCWTCAAPRGPDAFGSVALRAGVTMYDARFRRVSATDARAPTVIAAAASLRGLSRDQQLTRVHKIVGSRVTYMSDPDAMKVSDLWANAGETLATGWGDDEDIAIVKMQILKAAGFPAEDLFLSVGRHSSRGAHVVLLARAEQGFVMLDHLRQLPVDADYRTTEFTPVVTVGKDGSWIHGYRRAAVATR